jgi:hypothetical protein
VHPSSAAPNLVAPPAPIDRQPWHSVLYQVVRDNIATLFQASEDGFGTALPQFVRDELQGYLGCQVLGRGFAHMLCKDCGKPELVAFCCRGRGFCPCCTGRRMAQTAANLTQFVLPDVPLRQFVLTLPHALRPLVAYNRTLLGRIYAIFYDSIQRFYQRRLADLGHTGGRTGSVTAIQRASSDLRLNPHLHGVFLDGVFIERDDDELGFVELPALSELDVCELLQTISARVLEHLRRQGLLSDDNDVALGAQEADGEQLVLSALAAAASFGNDLAGPETRPGRVPYLHETFAQPRTEGPLCAAYGGFSLHANTRVHAGDKPGRERLIKYILRPPLAAERIERINEHDDQQGGRVRLRLKRPFGDGTWAVEMDELSLVARLAALVPPPWQNQVRYSGVLATASKLRPRIVPKPPAEPTLAEQPPCDHDGLASELDRSAQRTVPKGNGCRYWPWRLLKARTFGEPTTKCSHCEGELTLRALVQDPDSIHRILSHLGLPTDVPKPAPARGPPYYRGRVRRIRHGGPQQDLLP